MIPNDRGLKSPSDGRTARPTAPSLFQTGSVAMLGAIILSVAPGIGSYPDAIGALALLALIFWAVEALGAIYDLGAAVASEVRT